MTLILSMTTPDEVLHVSDRQVTLLEPSGQKSVHSPIENKSIILRTRDAICVLGYTGNAYVGSTPTDQWLAELIAGGPMQGFVWMGKHGRVKRSLNQAIWQIKSALAAGALGVGQTLTINIAGFRRRRGYAVPFLAQFGWPAGFALAYDFMRLPRHPREFTKVLASGDPPSAEDCRKNFDEGAACAAAAGEHRQLGGLAQVIRARSASSELVGADLMAIRIRTSTRSVEWQFMPTEPHHAIMWGEGPFAAIYSPWIIAPTLVVAPSIATAHPTVHAGGWEIRPIEPERPSEKQSVLMVSSQRRKRRPL